MSAWVAAVSEEEGQVLSQLQYRGLLVKHVLGLHHLRVRVHGKKVADATAA